MPARRILCKSAAKCLSPLPRVDNRQGWWAASPAIVDLCSSSCANRQTLATCNLVTRSHLLELWSICCCYSPIFIALFWVMHLINCFTFLVAQCANMTTPKKYSKNHVQVVFSWQQSVLVNTLFNTLSVLQQNGTLRNEKSQDHERDMTCLFSLFQHSSPLTHQEAKYTPFSVSSLFCISCCPGEHLGIPSPPLLSLDQNSLMSQKYWVFVKLIAWNLAKIWYCW